jgi:hypothetical protein
MVCRVGSVGSVGRKERRMDAILLIVGLALALAGVVLIGFSVPIIASGLGGTLLVIGAMGAIGGLVLVGLGAVVQQLTRLTHALEAWPLPRSIVADGGANREAPTTPPAIPSSWLLAEPIDEDGAGKHADFQPELGSANEFMIGETRAGDRENAWPGSALNLAGGTDDSRDGKGAGNLLPEAGSGAPLDSASADTQENGLASTPKILKSGVIDGMAYTLYVDGSIEAELPQGIVRFGSLDELRGHLSGRG